MTIIPLILQTIARFCVSAVFLAGAIKNILNWHETETSLMTTLSDWQSYVGFSQKAQIAFAQLISISSILLLIATAILLLGGLFTLMGVRQKFSAFLLLVFLIPTTILYHPFWWADGSAYELQAIMFLKNLALIGYLMQNLLSTQPVSRTIISGDMNLS